MYRRSPQANALLGLLGEHQAKTICLRGLIASSAPIFFASLRANISESVLFVLNDADEAGYFYHDLIQSLGQDSAFFFPSSYRRAVKYGQKDAANEILRTEVLAQLAADKNIYIVTYPEALAELVVSKEKMDEQILSLAKHQRIALTAVVHSLRELGIKEVDYVYEPGQFAVRGSILDVYSYSCEYPFRIDFFDDEIDTIRTFDVQNQLSKDPRDRVEIVPELAHEKDVKQTFLSFLDSGTVLVMKDYVFVRDSIERIYKEGFSAQSLAERLADATEVEAEQIRHGMQRELNLCTGTSFHEESSSHVLVELGTNSEQNCTLRGMNVATFDFHMSPQPLFHKNFELLAQTLENYQLKGYQLYILVDSPKQQQRLQDILESEELGHYHVNFIPVEHTVHEGFVDDDKKCCFFTDHQIFDRFHKYNLRSDSARVGKMALTMKELQEMEPGDFIVHVDFGIGKFGGLVRVPVGESYQEMIRIIYRNNDKVDVSIHSLYKISKYRRGAAGEVPQLSTLGTGAWDRLKEKAKKKIKDIARDLIKLYAKRRREKGFAFSEDGYLQHELEASFLYEDTPDQSKATQDVKKDMESSRPMDRLVCGDVGFGKTEVAIRAAFKAACDGKQVAVLVPTTVLAFQHFQTFRHRLEGLPVTVEYLSRARSSKEMKRILAQLEEGRVDILIGTHKLISKTVKWKDLGLLIIDEEQKFGVSTKEKLRQLKVNVDTLTMSATPIPRTLQFSLMGARDMSIIRTPPPNRYPIHTELVTFSGDLIAEAINFEMSRNGQVYFVNDRISKLTELKFLIEKKVPDCRVAIGHGQMKPEELEKVIMGFVNYDYDVLLSTTIVENGIDISNANTIIVNDAHHFGLSDLHQMRGRVGRSNKKAFCYLVAPPKSVLTQEARRRLEALENFSELGSGFNLAMQDLDIRGAGNLLGSEQSGFMEDLGYETYQKILSQAVTELKNEEFNDMFDEEMQRGVQLTGDDFVDDCSFESDLEMYFPDTFVPGSSERMLLYRELDRLESDEELEEYRQRMVDRFGAIPKEAEELMQVVRLRRMGKHLGCEKIVLKQGYMQLQFVSNVQSPFYKSIVFSKIIQYVTTHIRECALKEKNNKHLLQMTHVTSVVQAVNLLAEMQK